MKTLLGYFLKGLLYVVPLAATLAILYYSFQFLDNLIPLEIPGLGLVLAIVLVTVIGFLGSTFVTNPIRQYFHNLLNRVPLIKTIYESIRDLLSAFVGDKKRFNKPVLVQISKEDGIEKLGFITESDLEDLGISNDKVAVYLPHSYNFSGNLFIVTKDRIRPLDNSAADIMKFIVSAGVASVDEEQT